MFEITRIMAYTVYIQKPDKMLTLEVFQIKSNQIKSFISKFQHQLKSMCKKQSMGNKNNQTIKKKKKKSIAIKEKQGTDYIKNISG